MPPGIVGTSFYSAFRRHSLACCRFGGQAVKLIRPSFRPGRGAVRRVPADRTVESRMKSRLRTAAGAYWRSSVIFLTGFGNVGPGIAYGARVVAAEWVADMRERPRLWSQIGLRCHPPTALADSATLFHSTESRLPVTTLKRVSFPSRQKRISNRCRPSRRSVSVTSGNQSGSAGST
jgi:hypothetical protein